MHVERFHINISERTLEDLRWRLAHARFPSAVRDAGWGYGSNLAYMRELVEYWLDGYDWRAQEALLNERLPQFLGDVDGFGTVGHGDTENAGFLRNDPAQGLSLITVILLTDEEDCSSSNTAAISTLRSTAMAAANEPYTTWICESVA